MGTNVGGDPAPDLRQVFRQGVTAWRAGELQTAGQIFIDEGRVMKANSAYLTSGNFKYPDIVSEIEPWLEKYNAGAETLITLGEVLQQCTFDAAERRIRANSELVHRLGGALEDYAKPRKNMFGDQIEGPINELIAELAS